MTESFRVEGHSDPDKLTNDLYGRMERWLNEAVSLGADEYSGSSDFMSMFDRLIDSELERI